MSMKKPFKNRYILIKIMLIVVVVSLLTATGFLVVSCSNTNYDQSALTIEFSKKIATFTMSKDATIKVERQTKYFVKEEVLPKKQKNIGNMVQYVFENDNSKLTFRVEKEGAITKAGYFLEQGKFETKFDKSDLDFIDSNNGKLPNGMQGLENLMLTNVGNNYFKTLAIGEKFDLRLYRNTAIVDNYSNNTAIEPDFEIQVTDNEIVRVEKQKENHFVITGLKQGVTKLKVSYNAIEVLTKDDFNLYKERNKKREVETTFAGGDGFAQKIEVKAANKAFDSEFDTVYFEGESGSLELDIADADFVKCNDKIVNGVNDKFRLTIKEGANFIEIIKDGNRSFMTIYGAKVKVVVSVDNYSVGNKIKIKVQGIYNILPKMSGVYNPTQNYTIGASPTKGSFLEIVFNNTSPIAAVYKSQYCYSNNTEFEFEIKPEYILDSKLQFDLQFYCEWWGGDLGSHRYITENGVNNNLNAECKHAYLGCFEKVTIIKK